jgi:hypothetical protein
MDQTDEVQLHSAFPPFKKSRLFAEASHKNKPSEPACQLICSFTCSLRVEFER